MEYKATLDWGSRLITGIITILFAGIILYNLWLFNTSSGNLTQFSATIFSSVLLIIVYLFCYLYGPTKYVIQNQKIVIKRPLKDIVLETKNIKDVYLAKKESMKWTIRTFGNGGLFGYYGEFKNGIFGNMTWYATKRNNYLIVETFEGKKIVLTPDNPDMITEIRKKLAIPIT